MCQCDEGACHSSDTTAVDGFFLILFSRLQTIVHLADCDARPTNDIAVGFFGADGPAEREAAGLLSHNQNRINAGTRSQEVVYQATDELLPHHQPNDANDSNQPTRRRSVTSPSTLLFRVGWPCFLTSIACGQCAERSNETVAFFYLSI